MQAKSFHRLPLQLKRLMHFIESCLHFFKAIFKESMFCENSGEKKAITAKKYVDFSFQTLPSYSNF